MKEVWLQENNSSEVRKVTGREWGRNQIIKDLVGIRQDHDFSVNEIENIIEFSAKSKIILLLF